MKIFKKALFFVGVAVIKGNDCEKTKIISVNKLDLFLIKDLYKISIRMHVQQWSKEKLSISKFKYVPSLYTLKIAWNTWICSLIH